MRRRQPPPATPITASQCTSGFVSTPRSIVSYTRKSAVTAVPGQDGDVVFSIRPPPCPSSLPVWSRFST